jgi:SAM-dependent methyltransferase
MNAAVARAYWTRLRDAQRVLDLGCGTGDLGRFKPHGRDVHGLEISAALAAQAAAFEEVRVWDLDASGPWPYEPNHFDAVVAKDVLEHLQRPWAALAEVRRVLKPGGLVLASVICHRGRRTWSDYTHVRGFTMRSARQMFDDAGFSVESVWRMGAIPLTSRFNLIGLVPQALRFAPFDWIWTSSYELRARKPVS